MKVKWKNNQKANELSKVLLAYHILKVWLEPLAKKSIDNHKELLCVTLERNWIIPIKEYISDSLLPDDASKAWKIRTTAARYIIHGDQLYQTMGNWPPLKCVTCKGGNYILQEVHKGICEVHIGTNALIRKIMRYGYFLPTIREDYREVVQTCHICQIHSNNHHVPQNKYQSITSPISFAQWGKDLFQRPREERNTLLSQSTTLPGGLRWRR